MKSESWENQWQLSTDCHCPVLQSSLTLFCLGRTLSSLHNNRCRSARSQSCIYSGFPPIIISTRLNTSPVYGIHIGLLCRSTYWWNFTKASKNFQHTSSTQPAQPPWVFSTYYSSLGELMTRQSCPEKHRRTIIRLLKVMNEIPGPFRELAVLSVSSLHHPFLRLMRITEFFQPKQYITLLKKICISKCYKNSSNIWTDFKPWKPVNWNIPPQPPLGVLPISMRTCQVFFNHFSTAILLSISSH